MDGQRIPKPLCVPFGKRRKQRQANQHVLYRTLQCDDARAFGCLDAPLSACQSATGSGAMGYVFDWVYVQSLLDTSAVGTDTCYGSRADRSSLECQGGPLLQSRTDDHEACQATTCKITYAARTRCICAQAS